MQKSTLRCQNCGLRTEVVLSDVETRGMRGLGYVSRFCRECRGTTRWVLYATPTAPTHLVDVGPEAEARGRILLIDDDDAILSVLGKALGKEQFELEMATSGRDAVTRLARGDYDVIISDIRMPGLDGRELFRFLDEYLPEAKERVVFITGDVGNPDTEAFLQEANRPYLAKPLDIAALLEIVKLFLPQPEQADDSAPG